MDSKPGALGQVLGNLIDNALLHGHEGQGPGKVWLSAWPIDANRIGLSVRDAGKGMDAAVQERMFDPFFTTRMGRGGTGLGLHISHSLVTHVLGGSIKVESRVGEGTTVSIELPRVAPMPG
jgi:signal transduction histidine kinase